MRSKKISKNRNFSWLKKLSAFLISIIIIVAVAGTVLVNRALDRISYVYTSEGEKNANNGIGQAAFIDFKEYKSELYDLDQPLKELVAKETHKPGKDNWHHNLIILNLGDKEKTDSNVQMAILSQNLSEGRQVLQFVNPNLYVNLSGLGNNPLGQSWLLGGVNSVASTLARNLDITIDNTYMLSASKLVDLIDSIKGIALKIDDVSLQLLQKNQEFLENLLNGGKRGNAVKHMNFKQYKETSIADGTLAVAYAGLGGTTEKGNLVMVTLLEQIGKEFHDLTWLKRWNFVKTFFSCLTTDASRFEIWKTVNRSMMLGADINCVQLPHPDTIKEIKLGPHQIIDMNIYNIRKQFYQNLASPEETEVEESGKSEPVM